MFFTPIRQLLSSTYTPLVVDVKDTEYENSRLLHPIYLLSWTVSGDQINFRVKVKNQGWVGLGFDNDRTGLLLGSSSSHRPILPVASHHSHARCHHAVLCSGYNEKWGHHLYGPVQ